MPMPQNFVALLAAGVVGIVCAATVYVVEYYFQDRRRHSMSRDFARMNDELTLLRQEVDILSQRKKKAASHTHKRESKKCESYISNSTTTEDYCSALASDSSDLEFYDVSDDEVNTTNLDLDLKNMDEILEQGNAKELESGISKLQNLCFEFPENPHLLWRLAKAHYKLYERSSDTNHLTKGIEACRSALSLKPELANVHKWLAILLGERTKFQPLREKISDGRLYKEHVDAAVRLDPSDASLHHMLGRFAYDVANLKWHERSAAAALSTGLPRSTHEEALAHFLEAERLAKKEWQENALFVAKCQIKLGRAPDAVAVLERAKAMKTDNGGDDQVCLEIKELLAKYKL